MSASGESVSGEIAPASRPGEPVREGGDTATAGRGGRRPRTHRAHPLWLAYALHRASGLGLALFLPIHFHTLSLAVTDRKALEGFLAFAELPLVKLAEFGLVFLLAVHLFGGLRLLALEWWSGAAAWTARQRTLAAAAVAGAFLVALLFLLSAM